jgi:cyclase
MRRGISFLLALLASLAVFGSPLAAQDLGPQFRKIKEGIYVQSARESNSNAGIILTSEGVVLVDSGHNPTDSRAVMEAVKKLTPLPVRFLIDTEVHGDHTTGHYVFSPPAVIINHAGAGEAMRKGFVPERMANLIRQSPEMAEAAKGYRMIPPQLEYNSKLTIHLGGKTIEVHYLKNVHSEADSAVWLPEDRVLFSASVAVPNQINILRPFVTIPDMLNAMKMLRGLNPEIVVPGHGTPGTTKIFDDEERYYALLLERVGAMVRAGKTLDQIKAELKMPEYAAWTAQERMPTNIEAAYRAVRGNN